MIDLSTAYEIRDVLDNKVIDSIIDEFGNIWYEAFKKLIASGVPPITLQKCKKANLLDYKIYGNSVQNGTPTPDNPIEVESVGEKTKNLVDISEIKLNQIISSGGVGSGYNFANKNGCVALIIECKPNTKYTLSSKTLLRRRISQINNGILVKDEVTTAGGTIPYTFTTSDTTNGIAIGLQVGNNPTEAITQEFVESEYIQIEEGSTVTEYEPYGYKIPVKVRGKNLFDKTKFSSIGYLNYDGSHIYQANWKISDYIVINGLDYITETYPLLGGSVAYTCFYDSNKNFLKSALQGNVTNKTIAIPQGSVYMRFCYKIADENDVQVEVGTQSTSYEPYVEPVTTNIYLNEPLRKIGNYKDYIDFVNGKVIRNTMYRSFTGNETITLPGSVIKGYTPFRYLDLNTTARQPFLCNYLTFSNKEYSQSSTECLAKYATSGQMFFVISNDRIPLNDITAFKNWLKELYLSDNPLKVYYGLATPTEETIELPTISTNEGTNIIEVGTSIEPSNMEIEYYGKEVKL